MDPETIVAGALTVLITSLTGGVTNAVAIWMLFHPHGEVRILGFRLHGAIPRNHARLARSIGKTVGERLLTPQDLAERLSAPQVRAAFDSAMARLADDLLLKEHGPLAGAIPAAAAEAVEQLVSDLGPRVADRVADFAGSEAFREMAAGWVAELRRDLADKPVGDLLTPARREAVAGQVDAWVADLAGGEDMEHALHEWIAHQVISLEQDPRPLVDRLPPGVLAPVEQAISDYLPTAVDRLAGLLGDPETRRTISAALRTAFDGAARQLLIHERILARLVVKESTFERLLDGLERKGFERFAAAITAPAVRARVASAVHQSLLGLLQMPLSERLARMGPDRREALVSTLGEWAVTAARSSATRASVRRVLERGLEAAGARTWDEVLDRIPTDSLTGAIADALRSEPGKAWVANSVTRGVRTVLAKPIGRPADWLGQETSDALRRGVADTTWGWLQEQIPQVVERLELPAMVEQKVLGFSTYRMEEIIRGVTHRELQMIVRLGYLLGGMVGLLAFALNRML